MIGRRIVSRPVQWFRWRPVQNMVLQAAVAAVDGWMAVVPRRRPSATAIGQCKIISHRGEHDNKTVHENTMRAFETARSAGVWGIEADIRWTADLVPVIVHDPDAERVFGDPTVVAEVPFKTLRERLPEIPTLAELVSEFGGSSHLMLELKAEHFPDPQRQWRILGEHLSGLQPVNDYHFLALDTALFETFAIEPRQCCLSVSMQSVAPLSESTLAGGYGGLTGHYLLLNSRLQEKHEQASQRIGTGFIRSRFGLYRELNRGVEWVFTNDAVKLQKIIDGLR